MSFGAIWIQYKRKSFNNLQTFWAYPLSSFSDLSVWALNCFLTFILWKKSICLAGIRTKLNRFNSIRWSHLSAMLTAFYKVYASIMDLTFGLMVAFFEIWLILCYDTVAIVIVVVADAVAAVYELWCLLLLLLFYCCCRLHCRFVAFIILLFLLLFMLVLCAFQQRKKQT